MLTGFIVCFSLLWPPRTVLRVRICQIKPWGGLLKFRRLKQEGLSPKARLLCTQDSPMHPITRQRLNNRALAVRQGGTVRMLLLTRRSQACEWLRTVSGSPGLLVARLKGFPHVTGRREHSNTQPHVEASFPHTPQQPQLPYNFPWKEGSDKIKF